MDEEVFIPDYEPDEDDLSKIDVNYVRGGTSRHSKGRKCPSCPGRFTNVRRHVLRSHLPWYTSPVTACWECKLQFGQTSLLDAHLKEFHNASSEGRKFDSDKQQLWVELVNGLLDAVCEDHNCASVSDLCHFAEERIRLDKNSEPVFQQNDLSSLCIFNELNSFTMDTPVITVQKPFFRIQPASLEDSRPIDFLSDNKENLVSLELPKCFKPKSSVTVPDINLIDSHFHLDMFTKKIRNEVLPTFQWNWGGISYRISLLIANYCYPRNWSSSRERSRLRKDTRLRFTYGIHPRMVTMEGTTTLDSWIEDMDDMLKTTGVVAVGECELDDTDRKTDINKQIRYFEKQIVIAARNRLPLVIHCRGGKRIDELCLNSLTRILPKSYRVHRHCFTEGWTRTRNGKLPFLTASLECLRSSS